MPRIGLPPRLRGSTITSGRSAHCAKENSAFPQRLAGQDTLQPPHRSPSFAGDCRADMLLQHRSFDANAGRRNTSWELGRGRRAQRHRGHPGCISRLGSVHGSGARKLTWAASGTRARSSRPTQSTSRTLGPRFTASARYFWKVQMWDAADSLSSWSTVQSKGGRSARCVSLVFRGWAWSPKI